VLVSDDLFLSVHSENFRLFEIRLVFLDTGEAECFIITIMVVAEDCSDTFLTGLAVWFWDE
jgi:hypothetical protein